MDSPRLLTLDEVLRGDCETVDSRLAHRPVGDLVLPTGELLTCELSPQPSQPPLTRRVAPGGYPVSLCSRLDPQTGRPLHACFLVVRFAGEPVTRWEQASMPAGNRSPLGFAERFAFPVETKRVVVLDRALAARLDDAAVSAADTALFAQMSSGNLAVRHLLDDRAGATCIAVAGGTGAVQAYWGMNGAGRPSALIVDLKAQPIAKPEALEGEGLQRRVATLKQVLLDALRSGVDGHALAALRELEDLGGAPARALAQLVELFIFQSPSPQTGDAARAVLGRLVDADPLLRQTYRELLATGQPPPRLACVVAVVAQARWRDETDVAAALVRLLETTSEERLIGELFPAIARVRHLLPAGEVERRLEPFLSHPHPTLRTRALQTLVGDSSELAFAIREGRKPTPEERRRRLAWMDRLSADPVPAVRRAANELLRSTLLNTPAHHGRLIRALSDPDPFVALEMAEALIRQRSKLAEDLLAPILQRLRGLAANAQLPAELRGACSSLVASASKPSPPPLPSRPRYAAPQLELRDVPGGRLRLTVAGKILFDVEARRLLAVSTRPATPGQAWLVLSGCLKPYQLENASGTSVAVGPLPDAQATDLAKALDHALKLPLDPVFVSAEALRHAPGAYHGTFLETEGEWQLAPDISSFGNAWFTRPNGFAPPIAFGRMRVRVSGIWHSFPKPKAISLGPPGGYGHMGMWPAELEAHQVSVLGVSS